MKTEQLCATYGITFYELRDRLWSHDNTQIQPYLPLLNALQYHPLYLVSKPQKNCLQLMCEGWHLAVRPRDDMNLLITSIIRYYDEQSTARTIHWHPAMAIWCLDMLRDYQKEVNHYGSVTQEVSTRDVTQWRNERWFQDLCGYIKEYFATLDIEEKVSIFYSLHELQWPFLSQNLPTTEQLLIEQQRHLSYEEMLSALNTYHQHTEIPLSW